MTQHGSLQVKAMLFQVTKHLFDPHSAPVKLQGHPQIRQIGSQTPGFFLAAFPMHQQVDRINFTGGQITSSQPETLTGLVDVTTEGLPSAFFIEPDARITFLTQDIEPMPSIQLAQDRHRAEFAVSDQKNSRSSRDQLPYVGQQSQLLSSAAVSSDMLDPGPGDRDGSFSVCQTDDQQLVPKANLSAVDDQAYLSQMPVLSCQPLSGDRFVPFPHSNGRIGQQPAQPSSGAQQLGGAGDLPPTPAPTHRAALVDPHETGRGHD